METLNLDDHIFSCESCGYTCDTANGAVQHELSYHGGAQTCWRAVDRELALAGRGR